MPKHEKKVTQILSENLFPVVGIGASAGGIKAFQDLIKAIPLNSGMAYILIQHLAPDHESILSEILQKTTTLPVTEITDNIKVVPDHIYVIPSNQLLTANDGVLQLTPRIKGEKLNTIDLFFTSLAEVHQEHSIGVVLSGTGTDGTVGLKTIKDQGGVTIVQDEASSAHYGMPQSAINAAVVDFILPPGEIPLRLAEMARSSKLAPSDFNAAEDIKEENIFREILAFIKTKKNVDFNHYKQTTIRRRILRRKVVNRNESLKEYQHSLLENNAEVDALLKDLLIPVTAFFRDPKTFDILCESIFPLLFEEKTSTDSVRIWVAGCSTGEEAYSIAICLHEYFSDKIPLGKIQIFATDISELSIAKARSGLYKKNDVAGVSENRLKLFFTKIDGSFQVNKSIREMVVFATQNFLKDPPFARIDLVSCRNVLIYMEPYLQKKALSTFHYSLKSSGFLLLGKSETPGASAHSFIVFDKHDKIYRRNAAATPGSIPAQNERSEKTIKKKDASLQKIQSAKVELQKAVDDALLATFTKVGAIVNEQLEIVQFRGSTGEFLEAPSGKASHNILKMAREGLSFELRNALHKAKSGNEIVYKKGIFLGKSKRKVDIEVIPLQQTIDPYFLVLFEDSSTVVSSLKQIASKGLINTKEKNLKAALLNNEQLEKELAQAREDMRAITEDQEAANEELQSANEELLSGSEELQSLNEELETSKEEIQSSNEELSILNHELIERNEQLIHSRKYAEAIVMTIHEPLLVLSSDFRIRSANKSFYELFLTNELETEGKILAEIKGGIWDSASFRDRIQTILPDQSHFDNLEVQITLPNAQTRIMVFNARQLVNEINNEQLILLAIQDITDQKMIEQKLEKLVQERTHELNNVNTALLHSNENLQQFASIASHDLQEPLRKIKTFTALLDKRFTQNIPDEGKEVISKIKISADRMSILIKEVLDYSKIAHSTKEFVPTNLDAIIKHVLYDLELLVIETNAVINYNEPLPIVQAISLQMHQLFYNLLTNALKFRKENIPPIINISYTTLPDHEKKKYTGLGETGDYFEIIISDNGIGFEQQFAEQIFQIFERLHPVDEFEGTGVGLALCKKIIENHHGYIFAASTENQGATFHIILPTNLKN